MRKWVEHQNPRRHGYQGGRTKLHEKTQGGRSSRPAIRPEYNIIFFRFTPALKEVKEEVASLDIDVARIRSATLPRVSVKHNGYNTIMWYVRDGFIAKVGLLDTNTVSGEGRVAQNCECVVRKQPQVVRSCIQQLGALRIVRFKA